MHVVPQEPAEAWLQATASEYAGCLLLRKEQVMTHATASPRTRPQPPTGATHCVAHSQMIKPAQGIAAPSGTGDTEEDGGDASSAYDEDA